MTLELGVLVATVRKEQPIYGRIVWGDFKHSLFHVVWADKTKSKESGESLRKSTAAAEALLNDANAHKVANDILKLAELSVRPRKAKHRKRYPG